MMSKIYELYSPDQRKIDNLKRRIRGYQKMEKDLQRDIRKTNNKNRELQQRIEKAVEYINNSGWLEEDCFYNFKELEQVQELLEILNGGENNR